MFGVGRPPSLNEQLTLVMKDLGQELLPEDEQVAAAFLETEGHVSLDDLVRILAERGTPQDASLAARTMRLLCDLGIAQQVRLRGTSFFEHLHLDYHHDHLVCVRCGKIIEFVESAIERKQRRVCQRYGFTPLMHRLEIRGVCAECAATVPATRPLCACLAGETVQVLEVLGGQGIRQRLMELGLTRGTEVTVLRADGPVTLDLRGSRLALGRNEAAKIQVGPTTPAADEEDGGPDECHHHHHGHDHHHHHHDHRTLDDAEPGERVCIVRILPGGGPIRQRLLDMGVTRGTELLVERKAPLGDPVEVAVKGCHLAIRKSEAAYIEIE